MTDLIDSYTPTIEITRQNNGVLQQACEEVIARCDDLQRQVEELKDDKDRTVGLLRQQLEQVSTDLVVSQSQLETQSSVLTLRRSQHHASLEDHDELQQEIDKLQTTVDQQRLHLKKQHKQIDDLHRSHELLKEEAERERLALQNYRAEHEELSALIASRQSSAIQALSHAHQQTKDQLAETELQLVAHVERCKQYEQAAELQRQTLEERHQQLQRSRAESFKLVKQAEQLQGQVADGLWVIETLEKEKLEKSLKEQRELNAKIATQLRVLEDKALA
jgi:chromosome segregation ATPase